MTSVTAILQIAILYFVIYAILKGAKGSRFGQALVGIGILAALLAAFSYVLHFDVLSTILKFLLAYLAISTVVIFQPEIRRILATVGAFGYFEKPKHYASGAATPELMFEIVKELSSTRTGALFAFEAGISLRGYENTGIALDAIISRELMRTLLTPPLPLHDGGIIIRNGRLAAAHCLFPVSNNPALIAHGMRHRAGVGLSEETDALVIIVSEETGIVSLAHNGRLVRFTENADDSSLRRWLARALDTGTRTTGILARLFEFLQKRAQAAASRREAAMGAKQPSQTAPDEKR
ncbi:MAG TPA: TIGR00159 family protein [Verrucomicrobia bacterium]|nr:TIGR00159 family protein [Verrucomicrobiota bacterium]